MKELLDLTACPYVNVIVPAFGGSVRLYSGSGPLEAVWIKVQDENGREVNYDRATGNTFQAAVRLTLKAAKALAEVLLCYAKTHRETEDG